MTGDSTSLIRQADEQALPGINQAFIDDTVKNLTRLADNAAFKGSLVGPSPAITALECGLQSVKNPADLTEIIKAMSDSGHFASVVPWLTEDNKSLRAVTFGEKDGRTVKAELRDPFTERPIDSCSKK